MHEVNRISFISRDTGDSRAFGYVYRRAENSHQFVGIKTEKAVGRSFSSASRYWRQRGDVRLGEWRPSPYDVSRSLQ